MKKLIKIIIFSCLLISIIACNAKVETSADKSQLNPEFEASPLNPESKASQLNPESEAPSIDPEFKIQKILADSYTKTLNHITHVVVRDQEINHSVLFGDQEINYSVVVERGYLRELGYLVVYTLKKDGSLDSILGINNHFFGSFNKLQVPLQYLPANAEKLAVVVHAYIEISKNSDRTSGNSFGNPVFVDGVMVKEEFNIIKNLT